MEYLTFLVHRDAVKAHSGDTGEMYKEMLQLVVNDNGQIWKRDPHLIEEFWHHMFGASNIDQPQNYGNMMHT